MNLTPLNINNVQAYQEAYHITLTPINKLKELNFYIVDQYNVKYGLVIDNTYITEDSISIVFKHVENVDYKRWTTKYNVIIYEHDTASYIIKEQRFMLKYMRDTNNEVIRTFKGIV